MVPVRGHARCEKYRVKTTLSPEKHVQQIWQQAHDHAVNTCGERGRAYRVANAALEHEYEKKGNK